MVVRKGEVKGGVNAHVLWERLMNASIEWAAPYHGKKHALTKSYTRQRETAQMTSSFAALLASDHAVAQRTRTEAHHSAIGIAVATYIGYPSCPLT